MRSFKIYPELNLVLYKPEGTLTASAISQFIDELLVDPNYHEHMLEFIDLSGVESWEIKLDELRTIFNREISKPGLHKVIDKMSIWAPTDIAFGISRMFYSVANFHSMEINISRDEKEAFAYLNIRANDLVSSDEKERPSNIKESSKINSQDKLQE